jgi:hypothetical protein
MLVLFDWMIEPCYKRCYVPDELSVFSTAKNPQLVINFNPTASNPFLSGAAY